MAIDINGANEYFHPGNHLKAAIWNGFDEDQKNAGIAQAKRMMTRLLDDSGITLDSAPSGDDDFPRPDLAVYEQACYILQCSPTLPNGEQSGPKFAMPSTGQQDRKQAPADPLQICPDAIYWLVESGIVTLSRG